MIIRSDSRAYEGVANLIALLADNHFGKEAARILAVLSQEDNGVITKKNFAVTRVRSVASSETMNLFRCDFIDAVQTAILLVYPSSTS